VADGEAGSRSTTPKIKREALPFIQYQIAGPGQVRIALYGIIKAAAGANQEEYMISK